MICACRCVSWNSGDQACMSMKQYLKFEIVLEMKTQTAQLKALLDHLWFCRSMYSHRQTAVTALSISNWIGQRNYKLKVNFWTRSGGGGLSGIFVFSTENNGFLSSITVYLLLKVLQFYAWSLLWLSTTVSQDPVCDSDFYHYKRPAPGCTHFSQHYEFCFHIMLLYPTSGAEWDQERLCKASQSPVSKTVLWAVEKVSWSNSQQFSFPDKFPGGRGNK